MEIVTTLEQIVVNCATTMRPPERLNVAESSEKYRRLKNPGGYTGPWRNDKVPYLVEVMERLTDLRFRSVVLCAPAQCGKTEVGLNWIGHTILNDPTDFMMIESTQERAGDFSKRRVWRLLEDSPEFKEQLMPGSNNDNVFHKKFKSGVIFTMGHPSASQLSGRPIPKLALTDYDRMTPNVDGEGTAFDLARRRTTTFGRNSMVYAESSPSFVISDSKWTPSTPHEAPPTEQIGIMSLYNRGDKRQWYWVCDVCEMAFSPCFTLFKWDETLNERPADAAASMYLACPHCEAKYYETPKEGRPGRDLMNSKGFWMKDGQSYSKVEKCVVGEGERTDTASFWLKGPAAAWQNWEEMVVDWIDAEREYALTGSEESMKTARGTQQALAHLPKALESQRKPAALQARAVDLGKRVVPINVRFLLAAIDVQKFRFEVQIHGVGLNGDIWVVDRFQIRMRLLRRNKGATTQKVNVRPFDYVEDWRLLLPKVLLKTYELADGSGRQMRIKACICDSGGMGEATSNAYETWRWLKKGPQEEDVDYDEYKDSWKKGVHKRFQLYKGSKNPEAPRTKIHFPESAKKDKFTGARGEIPILFVNTQTVKNHLDGILNREEDESGRIHFPNWLDKKFYEELCVETKDDKGMWVNPNGYPNESWDLFVMTLALMIERTQVDYYRINWQEPPDWAREWDSNSLVFDPNNEGGVANANESNYTFKELGKKLG